MTTIEPQGPPAPLSELAEAFLANGMSPGQCQMIAELFLRTAAELRRTGLALAVSADAGKAVGS